MEYEQPGDSKDGALMIALAFHQCFPSSIPGLGVICGLSLQLVLYASPLKPTFPNFNSILECRDISERSSCELLGALGVKKFRLHFYEQGK